MKTITLTTSQACLILAACRFTFKAFAKSSDLEKDTWMQELLETIESLAKQLDLSHDPLIREGLHQ